MTGFTLDTSGAVDMAPPGPLRPGCIQTLWSDLDPFTQGYVRAALESLGEPNGPKCLMQTASGANVIVGFSDLAPSTLAAMMKDCAEFQQSELCELGGEREGRWLWNTRQSGLSEELAEAFPPQTLSLGDDGLIYASEAGERYAEGCAVPLEDVRASFRKGR